VKVSIVLNPALAQAGNQGQLAIDQGTGNPLHYTAVSFDQALTASIPQNPPMDIMATQTQKVTTTKHTLVKEVA
jgi:hypothetical protein